MPPFFVSRPVPKLNPMSRPPMNRERLVTLCSAAVIFAAGAFAYAFIGSGTAQNAVPLNAPAVRPSLITPSSMAEVQLTFAPVVKRVAPAVVNVYARTVVQQQANPLLAD